MAGPLWSSRAPDPSRRRWPREGHGSTNAAWYRYLGSSNMFLVGKLQSSFSFPTEPRYITLLTLRYSTLHYTTGHYITVIAEHYRTLYFIHYIHHMHYIHYIHTHTLDTLHTLHVRTYIYIHFKHYIHLITYMQ